MTRYYVYNSNNVGEYICGDEDDIEEYYEKNNIDIEDIYKKYINGDELTDQQNVNLGVYYAVLNKQNVALELFKKVVDKNEDSNVMYNCGQTGNEEWHFDAAKKGNSKSYEYIEGMYYNPAETYLICKQYNIPFKKTNDTVYEKDLNIMINKCNIALKTTECPVCLENVNCIPMECNHYLCLSCYRIIVFRDKPCPVCKMKINH